VEGIVTFRGKQNTIYIQDRTGGLLVALSHTNSLRMGDFVQVTGSHLQTRFSPTLREADAKKIGAAAVPPPIPVSATEILNGKHDMELVTLPARLLETTKHSDNSIVLKLLDESTAFNAELDAPDIPQEWLPWARQSIIQVTGICSIGADRDGIPRNFRIILRSASDAVLIKKPPWWNFERTLKVVVVLGVLILLGLLWVAALNHQVRQQTMLLAERFSRENALRSRYKDLFENAKELIFTLGPHGQLITINKAAENLLGISRTEMRELNFAEFVIADQRERFKEFLQGCSEHDLGKLEEFSVVSRGGTTAFIELSCHLLKAEGQPNELQVIARDITQRKAAEEEISRLTVFLENRVAERTAQLEAANKELEAFSYSVSHDLRAPLRAIDGFSKILAEDKEQNPEESARLLQAIQKNARKMSQLIEDLLQFSRLTRSALQYEEVDMGRLFRSVFEELRAGLERPVEFEISDLPKARADLPMLRQVAVNLLSNAVKYSRGRTPARIEVGSKVEDGETVYFVRDNGVGFDMRYAPKLFQVFQRLHSDREFEGTGVGLAIVQRIIKRHLGRVWAEAALNEGATFYFALGGQSASGPAKPPGNL
jgi:PAS domain S-box-containing protein